MNEDATEQRKKQIVDAAMVLFLAKGLNNTSMNEIVKASGLSKGGVYHYFASKNDIVKSVIQAFADMQMTSLYSLMEVPDKSVREKMLIMIEFASQAHEEAKHLTQVTLDFFALAPHKPDIKEFIQGHYKNYLNLLTQLIERGIKSGEFRPETDAAQVAMGLAAIFDGLGVAYVVIGDQVDVMAVGKQTLIQVLDGISQPS